MASIKKCSLCEWFNGESGDGNQFCDEKEIYVNENDVACFRFESKEPSTHFTLSDIEDLRNELCLKCGKYHDAHLGACDGCRWKKGTK